MDPDTTAKLGLALWENVPYLKNAIRNVRRRLHDGKTVIAVFGPGGVGKTTLGTILADDFSPEKLAQNYVDTPDTETVWLKTNDAQSLLIAPGQRDRIAVHWPAIQTALTKANERIVINVVAWGYHTPHQDRLISSSSIPQFVAEARDEELKIITELADFLTRATGSLKMLTLVTKQDLWWNDRDAVKAHYESKEYAAQIARFTEAKGTQNFTHEYAYVSLMSRNLKSGKDEVLISTTQGYDIEISVESHKRMTNIIEGMLK